MTFPSHRKGERRQEAEGTATQEGGNNGGQRDGS